MSSVVVGAVYRLPHGRHVRVLSVHRARARALVVRDPHPFADDGMAKLADFTLAYLTAHGLRLPGTPEDLHVTV